MAQHKPVRLSPKDVRNVHWNFITEGIGRNNGIKKSGVDFRLRDASTCKIEQMARERAARLDKFK